MTTLKSHVLFMACSGLLLNACTGMPDMKTARQAAAKQDYKTAAVHYRELSDFGLPEAKMELGRMYLSGNGVPQNTTKALELFQEAQATGANPNTERYITQAQVKLGTDTLKNNNTGLSKKTGIQLLSSAAAKGDSQALFELGYAYEKGSGVNPDGKRAARYYEQAAQLGFPRAYAQLGRLYVKGIGVPQDYRTAEQYFLKAREKGVNVDNDLIKLQKKAG